MRPYKVEVIVRSTTVNPEGTMDEQQEVLITEYSDSDQEHVLKNFHIAKKVAVATTEAMEELANAAGFLTSLENAPQRVDNPGQGQGQGRGQVR